MTLAELRFLIALKEEQHFGRAAAACSVSQPALSSALRKLERELDVVLFERSRSGVKATAVGEEIVEQARKVLASATKIRDLARGDSDHLAEPLAVGVISAIAPYLLPQTVLHLQKSGSPLVLHAEEGRPSVLADKLRQGELDVLLTDSPLPDSDILTQPLYQEPFAVVMPRTHVLAAQTQLCPTDVCRYPVLLPGEDDCLHRQIREALPDLQAAAPDERQHRTGADSLETLRALVAGGMGLAVLPVSAAGALCSGLTTLVERPLVGAAAGRMVALAWRVTFPRHKAIDALRQAVIGCSPTEDHYTTEPEPGSHGLLVENRYW